MMKLPSVLLLLLATMKICSGFRPIECREIKDKDDTVRNGVYTIYPIEDEPGVEVYCDMETSGGGWTVFQRRIDGTVNFYRSWKDYVYGFGRASSEYWLGLEYIHEITNLKCCELMVEMEDFEGRFAFARFDTFAVNSACTSYSLDVSGYSGTAGDGMDYHNGMKFSTYDNDQDESSTQNCAERHLGGFWYKNCFWTNPNGLYLWGETTELLNVGVEWQSYKGSGYSMKKIIMKLRPKY